MHDVHTREIQVYLTPNRKEPFTQWLESIRNKARVEEYEQDLNNSNWKFRRLQTYWGRGL